ncbi:hypothetical protein TNCV_1358421 [Trichonephila clavipes]|uniref:Uncharacterized protein n=1 Tax=Trichonephila clavipes TaxID=2585209 RepID=A0A8X6VHX8_TRICX|nr:hypothetical protein TNCV_1358421 [Trichonephila clavipes]
MVICTIQSLFDSMPKRINTVITAKGGCFWVAILMACSVIPYQSDKLAGCVGDTETTRNPIGMQGHKCRSYELWCKEADKIEQKRQCINEAESFLLGGCTTTSF